MSICLNKLSSQIVQDFPDGLIMINTKTLKILDANSATINMFGYSRNELLGMDVYLLHPLEQKQGIKEILKHLHLHRLQYYCEIPCVRKDGECFYVDIASEIIEYDGYSVAIGFFRDRSKMQQESTAWMSMYQHLAEMVGYGVCLVNNHLIIYANQVFSDVLGATTSLQVIGKKVTDFIPVDQRDEYTKNYESIISGIKPMLTVKRRFIRFDGKEVCTYSRVSRVMFHGKWTIQAIIFASGMDTFTVVDQNHQEQKTSILLLTKKEVEVLRFIALGNTVKDIAYKMNIAERTVMTCISFNLMEQSRLKTK